VRVGTIGKQKTGREQKMRDTTEETVIRTLIDRGMTVTTVESCTGGMISAALTSVAGSSAVFHRGFVTYCDEAKHEMVGVREETLQNYTAVSRETALEMAAGGAQMAAADCALSVTGYAGPDTGSGEPVGLVYIGCTVRGETTAKRHLFLGDGAAIRRQATEAALQMLLERLTQMNI
jgi:nicotinamide-nucleotide amidase